MLNKLHKFIEKESLFFKDDRLLLAVSGGKDSMVLLHLFVQLDYPIGVAHYNHELRGPDSIQDAIFVQEICDQYSIPFYTRSVSDETNPLPKTTNTQDRARKLRYTYLQHIAKTHHYDYVLTAHHATDNIETLLLQLVRSAGLDGLTAMSPKLNNLCRPLLFATRNEVSTYYVQHGLQHREDSSNASDTYRRNYIRSHILPHFGELNPNWERTITKSIANLQDSNLLLKSYIQSNLATYLSTYDDKVVIHKGALRSVKGRQSLLYYLLSNYGFNSSQIEEIHTRFDLLHSGSQWHAGEYTLLHNREELILYNRSTLPSDDTMIIAPGQGIYTHNDVSLTITSDSIFTPHTHSHTAYFDPAALLFPLMLRKWQSGDTFSPLGMNGRQKKVKTFLIDHKISLLDKQQIHVITSQDEIIWVVGHRLDERYKVQELSSPCIKIEVSGL